MPCVTIRRRVAAVRARFLTRIGWRAVQWRLHDGLSAMECLVIATADGVELRFLYCGELYHSHPCATRAQAEREADEKKCEMMRVGWTEHRGVTGERLRTSTDRLCR